MNTLFLDFDGVLFNTLKEAYLLCRYAYYGIDETEPVDEEKYNLFYRYKFLVYNSWQYYYLMKVLEEYAVEDDNVIISKYKSALNDRRIALEEGFDSKYYKKRIDLKTNKFEFWNKLEEPFEFFFRIRDLKASSDIDVVIVSKKDYKSIKLRLEQFGLFLADDKIYAKEQLSIYKEKSDFIEEYIKKHNVNTAIFVDDNSNNLRPCEGIANLELLLAGWGNIAVDEIGLTCSEIIDRVKQIESL